MVHRKPTRQTRRRSTAKIQRGGDVASATAAALNELDKQLRELPSINRLFAEVDAPQGGGGGEADIANRYSMHVFREFEPLVRSRSYHAVKSLLAIYEPDVRRKVDQMKGRFRLLKMVRHDHPDLEDLAKAHHYYNALLKFIINTRAACVV